MKYISIDGDDIGNYISSYYLSNNEDGLKKISSELEVVIKEISMLLVEHNIEIIFCAADGILGKIDRELNLDDLVNRIKNTNSSRFTFSIGVGYDLRETYAALLSAKSNGKNKLVRYDQMIKE